MNALELVKEICATANQPRPSTLSNASDTTTQTVLACLNRAVSRIVSEWRWQALQKDVTVSLSVNHPAYDPASGGADIKKLLPDFNYLAVEQLYGVNGAEGATYTEPDEFKRLAAYGGGAQTYFSLYGNKLVFLPQLGMENVKLTLRYQSKYPVIETLNNSMRAKARFEYDSDECVFDDELLVLGGLQKYKQELGMDYDDAYSDYQQRLQRLKNTDTVMRPIYPTRGISGPVRPHIPNAAPAPED